MQGLVNVIVIIMSIVFNKGEQSFITKNQEIVGKEVNLKTITDILDGRLIVVVNRTLKELPIIVSGGVIIDAPVKDVWAKITDYESYRTYMPLVEGSTPSIKSENIIDTDFKLVFRIAFIPFSIEFSLRHLLQPYKRIDWYALKGDLSEDYGFWVNTN